MDTNDQFDVGRRTVLTTVGGLALTALAGAASADGHSGDGVEGLGLEVIGRYESGLFDEGGAEIVDYHAPTHQLFVVNAEAGGLDVLDVSDPTEPTKVGEVDVAGDIGDASNANSVSVSENVIAIAIEANVTQDDGYVGLYDPETYELLGSAQVGPLPDKVTFSPDGRMAVVANEGEPDDSYEVDPCGSISIVDVAESVSEPTVRTATFTDYIGMEDELREQGIRIFGPDAHAAQDFEPEYITIDDDSEVAWASLQENNAIAEIDLHAGEVTDIWPLGFKDHSIEGNGLDASNEDDGVNIRNWPINGILTPDAIGNYCVGGQHYIVTANEGDARDYEGFSEEASVSEVELDPDAFDFDEIEGVDSVEELQQPENLGSKNMTTTLGDENDDGVFESIYVFGGRSFSIFTADGELVFDSGDEFEQITAEALPENFNNDNAESDPDGRSDNKGPEPEGLTIGEIGDRTYAFIGFERVGGIITYDITDPEEPVYVDYVNERDFSVDLEAEIVEGGAPAGVAGDLGPEGLSFATAEESPIDDPLVFVGHEVSGTTTVFRVTSGESDASNHTEHRSRRRFRDISIVR